MKFWFRRKPRVPIEQVHAVFTEALKKATANAAPEERKNLMDIPVVSRSPEETDEEWLERITGLYRPFYDKQKEE